MRDPADFMANTTKLSALSKSSGEGGGGVEIVIFFPHCINHFKGRPEVGVVVSVLARAIIGLIDSRKALSLIKNNIIFPLLGCWVMSIRAWLFGLKKSSIAFPLSLLIDLRWSTIYDDLRRNGFAIEARVDNVWSHFSQFGHVLDVYLSKDERKTYQTASVF
ncbi:hypothetical protein CMV_024206 [Castanea mollissima]|uniref:Uncharacterized protein n=1 Tax=Castanea mollissima TaxID=60419 RepID=A0A8J4QF97_9ROSI|nr:hypothetical protein CMV_024206 [Castanea mollissima]